MTLEELRAKNAAARARKMMVIEPEIKVEQPKEEIKKEPKVEESEKVEEIIVEEKPVKKASPKKKSAKPENRAYMVVEDIENVNND